MKKVISTITMMMLAMLAFTFTSCEDEEIAYDLAGANGKIWSGMISRTYYNQWGWSGDNYRTTIEFYCYDNSGTKGYGYEVDYNIKDPHGEFWFSKFEWSVSHRVIELRYADTGYEPAYISEYSLSRKYFEGYIDDGSGSDIRFKLWLDTEFNDWDYYQYYHGPYNAPAKGKSVGGKEESVPQKVDFASKGVKKMLKVEAESK